MTISAISQKLEAYFAQIPELASSGKNISHDVNELSSVSFFAVGVLWKWKVTFFGLSH
jgi:hypothetical protein